MAAPNPINGASVVPDVSANSASSSSSSPAPPSEFDVIIGWVPLVEEIVAAECYGREGYTLLAMKPHGKVFKPEHLELCKGKRVLVCGSYFHRELHHLLDAGATRVDVWVYTHAGLVVLASPDFARNIESGMLSCRRFCIDTDRFPRATRLIRRSLEPESEHTEEDEAFYLGLMHMGYMGNYADPQRAAIHGWLRGGKPGGWDISEETLIQMGRIVTREHSRIAADIVHGARWITKPLITRADTTRVVTNMDDPNPAKWTERAGRITFEIKETRLSLRAVVSVSALIMPVVKKLVSEGDVHVGVVIRYNLGWGHRVVGSTSVTFYTDVGADMSWVEKAPWNGGGKADCKGTTLPELVPITTLLEWLREPYSSYTPKH